jgi:hypothetical protein
MCGEAGSTAACGIDKLQINYNMTTDPSHHPRPARAWSHAIPAQENPQHQACAVARSHGAILERAYEDAGNTAHDDHANHVANRLGALPLEGQLAEAYECDLGNVKYTTTYDPQEPSGKRHLTAIREPSDRHRTANWPPPGRPPDARRPPPAAILSVEPRRRPGVAKPTTSVHSAPNAW